MAWRTHLVWLSLSVAACGPDHGDPVAGRDAGERDASTADAHDLVDARADASVEVAHDAEVTTLEASLPDAQVADAQVADAQVADAQLVDAAAPDTGRPIDFAQADERVEPDFLCGHPSLTGSVLLDVGHRAPVAGLAIAGDRAITQDLQWFSAEGTRSHWVLWDLTTRHALASGDTGPYADGSSSSSYFYRPAQITSTRLLIPNFAAPSAELRDARTGALIANVPNEDLFLSSDGSYLWSVTYPTSGARLRVWSDQGVLRFDEPLNADRPFAAPGELRSWYFDADGARRLVRISASDGSRQDGATFLGDFPTWFGDGERFMTVDFPGGVRIYDADGTRRQDLTPITPFRWGGYGDWFFTLDQSWSVSVYRVGSGTPVHVEGPSDGLEETARHALAGSTLGHVTRVDRGSPPDYGGLAITMFDLARGPELAITRYVSPGPSTTPRIAGDRAGHWIAWSDGLYFGDIQGQPHRLGCLPVRELAGSDANMVAVATGVALERGRVMVFSLQPTQQFLGTFEPAWGWRMSLAHDGSALTTGSRFFGAPYYLQLPSGEPRAPEDYGAQLRLSDVLLSPHSSVVGKHVCTATNVCRVDVTDAQDNLLRQTQVPRGNLAAISPSGQRLAFTVPTNTYPAGEIYDHGVKSATIATPATDWLDEDRVLASDGVYDVLGNKLSSTGGSRAFGTTSAYDNRTNTIRDLRDGSVLWQGPSSQGGDVAGSHIVYLEGGSGARVFVAQP